MKVINFVIVMCGFLMCMDSSIEFKNFVGTLMLFVGGVATGIEVAMYRNSEIKEN